MCIYVQFTGCFDCLLARTTFFLLPDLEVYKILKTKQNFWKTKICFEILFLYLNFMFKYIFVFKYKM